jgi:hypothetical protein
MALRTENRVTIITCDKCGMTSIAASTNYNDVFFEEGWALHRGRKYTHLCNKCLPKKSREAMEFVKQKFNL